MSTNIGAGGGGGGSASQPLPEDGWYYSVSGANFGPVSRADLLARVSAGELTPQSMVWHELTGQWRPAGEVFVLTTETSLVTASFGKRVGAYLIDSVVLFVLLFLASMALAFVLTESGMVRRYSSLELIINLVMLVGTWGYFALQESGGAQATVGKRMLGTKVVDLEGSRISLARATGRHFAKIISGLILMLGFLMAAFTERNQALHDMIASTLVVER